MSTPVGPYSPAVRRRPVARVLGTDRHRAGPDGPVLVEGGFEAQAAPGPRQPVRRCCGGDGLGWAHVVKTTVFLTDMADYAAFNDIYVEVLGDHRPARSLVAVAGLPLGALVEIEVWAYGGVDRLEPARVDAVTAPRCRGRSGSPTERTVSMRWACSSPSLARRRRTWTSTVRAPP